MSATVGASPPGLDLPRLHGWLSADGSPLAGHVMSARHLEGGKSNYTYELTIDGRRYVLRRPPMGNVLPTAHDMGREYRVMSALAETQVPVPRTLLSCSDPSVVGAPFYIMEHVTGTSYFRADQLEALGQARTRLISEALIDTLVLLHQVDHESVGLADFGRPGGFAARQVRRWRKQLDASHTRDLLGLDALHASLLERVPSEAPTGVVHGDYKLDNVIVRDDRPRAVIDWEMATIGDTRTDVALLVVYQRLGAHLGSDAVTDSASAPGFLTEGEILERYVARSSRSLGDVGFYLALAAFKLAGIIEGVYFRHLNGQTVGSGFDYLSEAPELLIASGIASLKEKF